MNPAENAATFRRQHAQFAALVAISLALYWVPLQKIASLSWSDDRYSHLPLIPVVSALLVYWKRAEVFSQRKDPSGIGFFILLGAAIGYLLAGIPRLGPGEKLSLSIASVILLWAAMFTFCYGASALRAAAFPWGFLAFMIPIPESVLSWIIRVLQSASADISSGLFSLTGMPSFRQGFRFLLPGVEIEVANECSGIRSTLALLLVSVLAGYVLLRSPSRRILFAISAVPIGILKNAVRIVTLSYLGVYVDRAYLVGTFHHQYGGLVFSALSLFLLIPLLIVLRRTEGPIKKEGFESCTASATSKSADS